MATASKLSEEITVRQISHQDPAYEHVLRIRNNVLPQPLRGDLFQLDLSEECDDIALVAERHSCSANGGDGEPKKYVIGCVMLRILDSKTCKLRQTAIVPEEQGKQIGKLLVQGALNAAKERNMHRIYIHARLTSTGFYEKLGFKLVSNEKINENGNYYLAMEKFL